MTKIKSKGKANRKHFFLCLPGQKMFCIIIGLKSPKKFPPVAKKIGPNCQVFKKNSRVYGGFKLKIFKKTAKFKF